MPYSRQYVSRPRDLDVEVYYLKPEAEIMLASIATKQSKGDILVRKPPESTQNKKLPLIAAHANILNSQVDHFSLSYKTLDPIFDFLMTGPQSTIHSIG